MSRDDHSFFGHIMVSRCLHFEPLGIIYTVQTTLPPFNVLGIQRNEEDFFALYVKE